MLILPCLDLLPICVICNNCMLNAVEHMFINCTALISPRQSSQTNPGKQTIVINPLT